MSFFFNLSNENGTFHSIRQGIPLAFLFLFFIFAQKQFAFLFNQTQFHAVEPADSAQNISIKIIAFGKINGRNGFDAENR